VKTQRRFDERRILTPVYPADQDSECLDAGDHPAKREDPLSLDLQVGLKVDPTVQQVLNVGQ
jgi:hypothetical protein